MSKIKVLEPSVYNLISAGEVIEKPYGAVKELVENSIDAGANRIKIEVANGGFDLIAVTDNGYGIYEDDIDLAFVKHATSKLNSAAHLAAIDTLGFRGEALSSIAAVSRIKLTSRQHNSDIGVCVMVEDGVVSDKQHVSANIGTKIEVRDLFYNTPARKKFFKSPAHESAEITKFVTKLILSNPMLEITYVLDDKTIYSTKGNGLEEAIFEIYGADFLSNCIKVNYGNVNFRVEGYISGPEFTKPNRNYQTLSVNGRYVTDQGISSAILQAYKPYLMTRTFPAYVLDLTIPCDLVDVNVHPKKAEVRFAESRKVCGMFYRCISDRLNDFNFHRSVETFSAAQNQTTEHQFTREEMLDIFEKLEAEDKFELMNRDQTRDVHAMEEATIAADNKKAIRELGDRLEKELTVERARKMMGLDGEDVNQQPTFTHVDPTEEPEELTEEDDLYYRARILGALFKTYLILEIDDKVILVDQHAAHERILFDQFMANKTNDMQQVLIPYVFSVNDEEALFLEENKENILAAGIELENFGKNMYRIGAVSTLLSDIKMDEFVKYILSNVDEFKLDDKTLIVETLAKKACKAAVKAGYVMNEYEIKYILKEVCHNKILQCPHGRPITVVLTRTQIEKMFKRIV